jgi:tRNA pseudouridine55 synthase
VIHGFVIIDKPAGITSHGVVAQLRRVVRQKRVGHAGTLDPAATGVLVTALGNATRLIEYVQDATSKRYLAEVRLGVTTSTDDAEGETLGTSPVPPLDEAAIEQVLSAFRGPIEQVPPMYSALHHEGRRLHELAREGITVERAARPVTIERLELLAHTHDTLTLDVLCSKGTYIRSLARDLGTALGCGAHLASLCRTAVGEFTLADAHPLAGLTEESIPLTQVLLPAERAVLDWPAAQVDMETARRVRNGLPVALEVAGQRARIHAPGGELLALAHRAGELWQPDKVFDWS